MPAGAYAPLRTPWLRRLPAMHKGRSVPIEMDETSPQKSGTVATAIVSRPGVMQQSLRTSLAACPWIAVVASLGDGLTALNHVTSHPPALLVIDCNLLDEEVEALLAAIRARQLPVHCLVFIRTGQRKAWALAAGADSVVFHDSTPRELLACLAQFQEKEA